MTTVRITYQIVQDITSGDEYRVTFTVIDAVGIDRELFVLDSAYQLFTGVATIYDIRTWPRERDPDLMSYRASTVSRTFNTLADADAFNAYTRGRLEYLRIAWQRYIDGFAADTIVVTPTP